MRRNPLHEYAAAVMMFTRLPLGRVMPPLPADRFAYAVTWWPAAGWLIAAFTALVLWTAQLCVPLTVAVVVALMSRMMLTGALHEDGLADVADGLGGRVSRERALAIMKDSQIGSYGVLALVMYCLMYVTVLSSTGNALTAVLMIAGADPWARFCAGRLTAFLRYARPEGAKNGLTYPRPGVVDWLVALIAGVVPTATVVVLTGSSGPVWAAVASLLAIVVLMAWLHRRLGGYTGDCCGAACLVCEIVYMLTFSVYVL